MRKLFFALLIFTGLNGSAQNSELFFKSLPVLKGTEPEWVKLMYSENPNVFEVEDLFVNYFRNHPFEKNFHTQNYKHWLLEVEDYLTPDGFIQLNNLEKEQFVKNHSKWKKQKLKSGAEPHWKSIGPFETYRTASNVEGKFPVSWQVNVFCIDQCESSPDVLFCGTAAQGVWKTTDRGLNWSLMSLNEPVTGVSDIKVAATNENLVYFSAGKSVYKSTDGGQNWVVVYTITEGAFYQIIIDSQNHQNIFAVGNFGMYKTSDGGANWTKQFSEKCWDINFHPTNPQIIYLLKHNSEKVYTEFFKSIDGGSTWQQQLSGWYLPGTYSEAKDYGALIAVTPLTPDRVYVGMMGNHKEADDVWIGVYVSADKGDSWTNPIGRDGGPYSNPDHLNLATAGLLSGLSQSFYDYGFDASHTEEGRLFLGVVSLSISDDAGKSWLKVGGYSSSPGASIGYIHPDIQDIHVLGEDVWVTTDGGINYSADGLRTHESRKNGLAGSRFWGFSQGWNEDVMVGGRYHNGNSGHYESYGTGNFIRLGGAERATGYVNLMNPRLTYYGDLSASRILDKEFTGGYKTAPKLSMFPNETYYGGLSSELEYDPRYADHMYLGNESGFYKSTDGGANFKLLYDFGSGTLRDIEISRQNPDIIYCKHDNDFYRSEDGGKTWIGLPRPGTNSLKKMRLALNPGDDKELWTIALQGSNGKKVYRTTDSGVSWQNMTSDVLDNHSVVGIVYQAGSEKDYVYMVTNYGAFYWNNEQNNWSNFSDGLPAITKAGHIRTFYRDSKIRFASGRGIWEADFVKKSLPMAYPMTNNSHVYCSEDTVQFDCHSILDHEGASWEWSISPEPAYINSKNIRNPKMLFNTEGAYDVSLKVCDGEGNVSEKTIVEMITLSNECGKTTFAGKTANFNATGYIVTNEPDMIESVSQLAVECWVKSNVDAKSCVFSVEGVCNLFVLPDDKIYSFFDGSTSGSPQYTSNLNDGAWHHVVAQNNGSQTSVYVDGELIGSFNENLNMNQIEDLNRPTAIGGTWNGGSKFKGQIDEVCFWNKALTLGEIRGRRHLTKHSFSGTSLLNYFQFNSTGAKVYDNVGEKDASMQSVTKEVSTAPVGNGKSFSLDVNAGGKYSFNETGVSITFPQSGIYPNGEIVVSRLEEMPDQLPAKGNPKTSYWIVNNYGLNNSFSQLQEITFNKLEEINGAFAANKLYRRASNSFGNTWGDFIDYADGGVRGSDGSLVFSSENDIVKFGQFMIVNDGIATSVSSFNRNENVASIYPNPVNRNGKGNISYKGDEQLRIKIYSTSGKLLSDQILEKGSTEFDLKLLKQGVYLYSINGSSFISNGKLVIK